ncbi:DUF2127 domain-containing protein [Streptacidiphilus neutrinimicus]|uniref:DUF2127 domain-containing protein n=1 Tax=Streptacidiphilus neutrinimicus TaxID=105420 RepID=UPI0005A77EC5|nr:DUF2127 domain-containing protein [Streptacidiphilus neutrinimicus]
MARHRFNFELLTCASSGHVHAAPADVDERTGPLLVRRTEDGLRWQRCLRCDAWIPSRVPPEHEDAAEPGSEIVIPERGRALRDRYVLRLIALDRLLHFLLLGAAAVVVLLFTADRKRLSTPFYRVVDALQNGVGGVGARPGTGIAGELEKAFQASSSKLWLLGAALAAYALLEGVEAVGLWLARRWAEYLTFVATTILLVPEVWELTSRVTVFKIVALVVNIAVVVYLLHNKRLFGLRGGLRAQQREQQEDMSWEALERAFPGPHA